MDEQQAEELINKYSKGLCTSEEKAFVEAWFTAEMNKRNAKQDEPDYEFKEKELWNHISDKTIQKPTKNKIWLLMASAAAVLLVVSAAIFLYTYRINNQSDQANQLANDIAPGGNKAFLTLADGKRIVLTDARIGKLAEQSGVKITKATDGQLIYTVSDLTKKNNKVNEFNIIETPNGGQYQIKLPDGTKVWLNAASSLKFPSSFSRLVNRRVELIRGEAYFEVAKDKKHPFIVQTDQQEVEVLGTHFNINNYSDESFTKTTLFEGAVRVSPVDKDGTKEKSIVLKPNEQALLRANTVKVTDADTEEALAWKNGYFKFHDENIESVMRKVARWYNIKVQYSGSIPNQGLEGTMSREQNLSVVLNKLQTTGLVKFEVNGNTVIVSK